MNPARLEIQGVPPIAVEALLDYCYKDKLVSASLNILLILHFTIIVNTLLINDYCYKDKLVSASFNILVGAGLTDTMSTKVRTH